MKLKEKYFIDVHKGVTGLYILLLMQAYGTWGNVTSWTYLAGLFEGSFSMPRFSMLAWVMMFLGYAIHFSPDSWQERAEQFFKSGGPVLWTVALAVVTAACMLLGTGEQLAFIYYQF